MRRVWLGTTALAVGLGAGEAEAEPGIKLGIGGRYWATAGGNVTEHFSAGDTVRDYVFKQDVEVHFLGEATLDNGLLVGAKIELEGQTSPDQIDQVYVYFNVPIGQVRFGDTDGALSQLCYLVPSASVVFGADSPFFNFSNAGIFGYNATNGACYGIDDKATKVVLFSPTIEGFNFALSFTPDDTEDTRNTVAGAATRPDNDLGQNSEVLSVAANFTRDIGPVNVTIGGAGSWSFDREQQAIVFDPAVPLPCSAQVDERREYKGHLLLGYSGVTVGGVYALRQNVSNCFDGNDSRVYGAGATYEIDAWKFGLGWTRGEYELASFEDRYDVISLTASYALAPGLSIDGVVEYSDYDSGISPAFDYEGVGIGVATLISF